MSGDKDVKQANKCVERMSKTIALLKECGLVGAASRLERVRVSVVDEIADMEEDDE